MLRVPPMGLFPVGRVDRVELALQGGECVLASPLLTGPGFAHALREDLRPDGMDLAGAARRDLHVAGALQRHIMRKASGTLGPQASSPWLRRMTAGLSPMSRTSRFFSPSSDRKRVVQGKRG